MNCANARVNEKDLAELDLSCWRVAGIGAEPISAEQLHQFAECFRQVNFDDKTFMPCYGLAEMRWLSASLTKALGLWLTKWIATS